MMWKSQGDLDIWNDIGEPLSAVNIQMLLLSINIIKVPLEKCNPFSSVKTVAEHVVILN